MYYRDGLGTYSITEHKDGSATLRMSNNGNRLKKDYKTVASAKRALSRFCGGMPIWIK